jgi:hypothetical protein
MRFSKPFVLAISVALCCFCAAGRTAAQAPDPDNKKLQERIGQLEIQMEKK